MILLLVGVLLVPVVALAPAAGGVLAGGILVAGGTALRPAQAVVGYIALDPLIAGLDRGQVVPYLRLNEVLLVPILGGLALFLVRRCRHSSRTLHGLHGLDVVVGAVTVTSSVSPLLWMYARGRAITTDDLLYALILWKLLIVYTVARLILRDVRAARAALSATVVSAGLIGVVGVLQALGVGPVNNVLATLFDAGDGYVVNTYRAASTLGNPIAFGDVMLYAGIIAAAVALRSSRRVPVLWAAAAAVLALCALASGQVSIAVGLAIAGTVFAIVTRTLRRAVLVAAAFVAVALTVLGPVLAARLSSPDPRTGLPTSWSGRYGRLENLRQYFWPRIIADYNWLFGVQTSARVHGRESWRPWVWIESGYTWALWSGGMMLLVAVLALLLTMARTGRRLARSEEPTAGAMGTVLTTVAWMLAGLLAFDPHLTFRGAADYFFVLLALGANLDRTARLPAASTGTNGHPRDGWTYAGPGPAG